MNTLEQAQAAVQAARAKVIELEAASAYVTDALPKARQELDAAVAAERRLTQADGTAADNQRQAEIDRLTAALKEARHHA